MVRWWQGKLEQLYTSEGSAPRGWRGPDGSLWVLEGSSLSRIAGGRKIPVERDGVLTGNVFDVYSENGRTFWIASSEGIAQGITTLVAALGALWAGSRLAGRFFLWDSARGARVRANFPHLVRYLCTSTDLKE